MLKLYFCPHNLSPTYFILSWSSSGSYWTSVKFTYIYTSLILFIYIYIYIYLLTPWCRVLLEKLTGLQLVKKFPAFHGSWRFITALTSVCTSRMWVFLNNNVLQGGVVSTSPNPQAGGYIYIYIYSFIHSFGMCRMRWFLAILRNFFHSSLLGTLSCHPSPPTIHTFSLTSSCHLFLGLPLDLVPKFIYNILLGILFSSILCTCPNQCNLFNCIFSIIVGF